MYLNILGLRIFVGNAAGVVWGLCFAFIVVILVIIITGACVCMRLLVVGVIYVL